MAFFNQLWWFIVAVGVLVVVHEFGHFAAARLCGMRTDVFSIGFGPRLLGFRKGRGVTFGKLPATDESDGTCDYRLSMLPVGGYVKIAGMIDESFDTDFVSRAPQPWEFRAHPMWQKVIVISAGVMMNVLLAIGIFSAVQGSIGQERMLTTTVGAVVPGTPAAKSGLQAGDRIVSLNGSALHDWTAFMEEAFLGSGDSLSLAVSRGGSTIPLTISRRSLPGGPSDTAGIEELLGAIAEGRATLITSIIAGSPAEGAGFAAGDTILSVNGSRTLTQHQFSNVARSHRGVGISVAVHRGSDTLTKAVTPDAGGKIGIGIATTFTGPVQREHYSFAGAISAGTRDLLMQSSLFARTLWNVATGKSSVRDQLGGPVRIAQMAAQSAESGAFGFLLFIGLLSVSLAVLNILPFPALDGGHLVVIVIEGAIRREISTRIKLAYQQVGFAVLILLSLYVLYNDLHR